MANFFYATAVYADGRTEHYNHLLWYLDGTPDEEGHALLQSLKNKKESGEIIKLHIDYES